MKTIINAQQTRAFSTDYCEICKRETGTTYPTGKCGGCLMMKLAIKFWD